MEINILKKGIKFQCQGSANCCVSRGSYGFVFLSKKDIDRFAKNFNISINEFKSKYCQKTDGYVHLKETRKNGECIFLKNKKCKVYKARPTQCRTWPFWKENMNAKIWNNEIINFCPGIGKGKLISKKEIDKIIKIDQDNDKEIEKQTVNPQTK